MARPLRASRADILDGQQCTTHHGTVAELARTAPRARAVENRIFVDSGKRLTSAGITAGIDLMLHIVAPETSHTTALAIARHLVVYLRRSGADPQLSPWLEGRNHIHPAIHCCQDAIVADPAREWSVAALAKFAGASHRNLSRLFNDQTDMSVTHYVNQIRIALVHELVTSSRLDMARVAEQAGFACARQFRRAWNRVHGMAPSRLRRERPSR
ncbi:MAG: helix-turn-helix domain-containing protein [Sphingomonas sp.]|uniref:GlxA family transcriptional regulator n=1 Tax=Sphingomonas sp. TaxID=28214 RepID=UPI001AD5802B|nr:helix-turn-helix domain-containing protein [Sphingomonas sp.]MBN8809396.1 helix-turn-helix domain-containing protein [Sphingomonas sp.]